MAKRVVRSRLAVAGVLAVVMAHASPAAADPDPWFGKDKALHFGVSAAIAGGSYALSAALFEARGHALLAAGGVTLAAGLGKEALDLAGFGDPSWKDLTADFAGMLVGLAIGWSLDLLVRGVSDQHPLFALPHENSAAPVAASSPSRLGRLVVTF